MRRLLLVATVFLGLAAGPAAAAPLTWTDSVEADRFQPFGNSMAVYSLSCGGTALCVGLGGEGLVAVSKNPDSASPTWSIPRPTGSVSPARAVSCPTASFCVAVANEGEVLTSTDPGADPAVWASTTVPVPAGNVLNGILEHVSCPTASFCAAADPGGYVYASTNPGAASPTWVATADPVGVARLTCASSALCVVTNGEGGVRISTNPGAASPVWSTAVDITAGDNWLTAISCPTVTFCLAGSTNGLAYRSVNPTADSPVWAELTTTAGYIVRNVSCPTPDMCTASGNSGAITSTNPGAATPVWRVRTFGGVALNQVSCGTTSFCMVGGNTDARGFVTRDASLPSPSPNWAAIGQISGANKLLSAACPDETLCLAGDNGGRILSTPNPTAVGAMWRATAFPGANLVMSVECPSASLCVAVAKNTRARVSHDPAAAEPHWVATETPSLAPQDLSCPTVNRCVAINAADGGAVLDDVSKIGTIDEPGPVWRDAKQVDGASGLVALDCPTATHCAAVDSAGSVLTTTDVTAADPVWTNVTPPPGGLPLVDVNCPSVELCTVVDLLHMAVWSTNPFAAAPVWNGPVANVGTALACSSTTFCVAGLGNVVRTSTAPGAWSAVSVLDEGDLISTVACAGDRLCLAGDDLGHVAFGVAVPQNGGAPTVSGTATVDSALTATGGTWTGVPAVSFAWERCDTACTSIEGATAASYTVTAADVGRTLLVTETAANAGGTATAASAVTGVVPVPPDVIATPTPTPTPALPDVIAMPTPTPAPPQVVTAAMIKARLATAVANRFTLSFTAPTAGTLVVRWYSIKTKRKKAVLLATGRRKYTRPGVGKVVMKLSKKGKRILRKGKRVKITAKATFTPLGGKAVTVSKKLTVKR